MEVTINNQKYRAISRKRDKASKTAFQLQLMTAMFMYGMDGPKEKKETVYTLEFIASEYQLILEKKSALSANERRRIEYLFNYHFEPIS